MRRQSERDDYLAESLDRRFEIRARRRPFEDDAAELKMFGEAYCLRIRGVQRNRSTRGAFCYVEAV